MKVLLVTHIFPPAIDGGSKIIAKIGESLANHHHQILVLTSNCSSTDDFVNPKAAPIKSSDLNIIRLPVYRHLRRPFKLLSLFSDFFSIFQLGPAFKFIPFLKSLIYISRFHPDIIIAGPLPTTIVLYARFFRLITRSKLVILPCFHENDPGFLKKPLIQVLRKSDLILTLTNHEKTILNHHCFVLGAGVDQSFLINPKNITFPKYSNILFLGNFAAHKGVDTLIAAFSKLSPANPNLTLTLAGQKTLYYPVIQKQLDCLSSSIKQKITIIPKLYNQNRLKLYLDSCSLLVLPSIHESFGLVFIESWARGKPVIGADIPPVSELIHKTAGGLLFLPESQIDLAKKISVLLSQPSRLARLGLNGHQYVTNHFTWDKIGQRLCTKLSPLS